MSKCKILVDCLSDYVGQNIYSVLGQNNGRLHVYVNEDADYIRMPEFGYILVPTSFNTTDMLQQCS